MKKEKSIMGNFRGSIRAVSGDAEPVLIVGNPHTLVE